MTNFFNKYSLRTKLVLLYSLLLISSLVLVSYYSYWNIWQLLIDNKVTHLRARAKPVIEHWLLQQKLTNTDSLKNNFSIQSARRLAYDLTSKNTVALILNKNGEILANGKRLKEEPLPPPPNLQYFNQAISGNNEVTYFSKVHNKNVLVFLIPVRPQPGSQNIFAVIQISTSLSDINKILFRHASKQITAIGVILLLGILFGYWLIGVNLKGLQNLSRTCEEIAKGNFERRTHIKKRNDEIGKLAYSFDIMMDKLETLFNSQKRFVANAAHELLTPLTGLRGSLDVLLRGAQDDPAHVSRLSKGMYKEVNHLIRLCDRLLSLSRLESGLNVNKKRIDLQAFINDFKEKAKSLLKANILIVQKGPGAAITADPDLFEQILFNLLSNAVRYSAPQTTITISWKLIPDFVEISVTDQGYGMDEETLLHVFEPFFRGKTQNVAPEKGAGLGLVLTKSMVEAHGGTIKIDTVQGKGTNVSFTMPV